MSLWEIYAGTKMREAMIRAKSFNKWDEKWENGYYSNGSVRSDSRFLASKNKIKVLPNATYYVKAPAQLEIFGYDTNGTYLRQISASAVNGSINIPSDVGFITFSSKSANTITTYNNNICINISGARNGEYQPYGRP